MAEKPESKRNDSVEVIQRPTICWGTRRPPLNYEPAPNVSVMTVPPTPRLPVPLDGAEHFEGLRVCVDVCVYDPVFSRGPVLCLGLGSGSGIPSPRRAPDAELGYSLSAAAAGRRGRSPRRNTWSPDFP